MVAPSDQDAQETPSYEEDEAVDALLSRWGDEDERSPSAKTGEGAEDAEEGAESSEAADNDETDGDDSEADTEDPQEDDNDDSAEDDEQSSEDAPKSTSAPSDEAKVKVTVDGEEKEVSVGELKRLAGQEASLTQKSQQVAEARKEAESVKEKNEQALTTLQERASERLKPYQDIDFNLAAQQLSPEEYKALKNEYETLKSDHDYVTQELDKAVEQRKQEQQKQFQEQAKKAHEVLSDPEKGIPNWSKETYNEMRSYAVEQGMDESTVNSITDPGALKMIWKAQQYDKGKQVTTEKKAKASPKKTTQPSRTKQPKASRSDKAMKALKDKGDEDSAVAALVSRWGGDE